MSTKAEASSLNAVHGRQENYEVVEDDTRKANNIPRKIDE
jgi:hypothetical protein